MTRKPLAHDNKKTKQTVNVERPPTRVAAAVAVGGLGPALEKRQHSCGFARDAWPQNTRTPPSRRQTKTKAIRSLVPGMHGPERTNALRAKLDEAKPLLTTRVARLQEHQQRRPCNNHTKNNGKTSTRDVPRELSRAPANRRHGVTVLCIQVQLPVHHKTPSTPPSTNTQDIQLETDLNIEHTMVLRKARPYVRSDLTGQGARHKSNPKLCARSLMDGPWTRTFMSFLYLPSESEGSESTTRRLLLYRRNIHKKIDIILGFAPRPNKTSCGCYYSFVFSGITTYPRRPP